MVIGTNFGGWPRRPPPLKWKSIEVQRLPSLAGSYRVNGKARSSRFYFALVPLNEYPPRFVPSDAARTVVAGVALSISWRHRHAHTLVACCSSAAALAASTRCFSATKADSRLPTSVPSSFVDGAGKAARRALASLAPVGGPVRGEHWRVGAGGVGVRNRRDIRRWQRAECRRRLPDPAGAPSIF